MLKLTLYKKGHGILLPHPFLLYRLFIVAGFLASFAKVSTAFSLFPLSYASIVSDSYTPFSPDSTDPRAVWIRSLAAA